MRCMSTKFGVASSSRFSSRMRAQRHAHKGTYATEHPTHASATIGVGEKA